MTLIKTFYSIEALKPHPFYVSHKKKTVIPLAVSGQKQGSLRVSLANATTVKELCSSSSR